MNYSQAKGMKISKMTLGTAQLGFEYGIANKTGKPNLQSAYNILQLAVNAGINIFDTASDYGNSEEIIGSFLTSYNKISVPETPIIITKIPKVQCIGAPSFQVVYDQVKRSILHSAKRLKIEKIPICLLHNASDMIEYGGLITKSLIRLREEKLIKMIGVSVYQLREVREFLKIEEFDVIQVPINIFNNRLIKKELLNELAQKGITIFARSVFLQGLFFLEPDSLPPHLQLANKPLQQLGKLSSDLGISTAELALRFVRDSPGITSVVLGVETVDQLKENIKLMSSSPLSSETKQRILDIFPDMPEELINPSMWKINPDRL